MGSWQINNSQLSELVHGVILRPAADRLFRAGGTFFVGGALPVYETLETMFESHCQEATSLFYLTLDSGRGLVNGIRLAEQIKRNFNVRLMASLPGEAKTELPEKLYLVGVDNLEINFSDNQSDYMALLAAGAAVYPRWRIATSSLPVNGSYLSKKTIDQLQSGIVPLPVVLPGMETDRIAPALADLAAAWDEHQADLTYYVPLLGVIAAMAPARRSGRLGSLIGRIREQGDLARTELHRHLRRVQATDSLDSAGL